MVCNGTGMVSAKEERKYANGVTKIIKGHSKCKNCFGSGIENYEPSSEPKRKRSW